MLNRQIYDFSVDHNTKDITDTVCIHVFINIKRKEKDII